MKENEEQHTYSRLMDYSLRIMMNLIYIILFGILFTLGYLLFGDHLDALLNQKKYTVEELALIEKRAKALSVEDKNDWNKVINGIHVRTGFKADPNLNIVIGACTSCHSSKLVIQNRASREGWKGMIRWMQETQGLPDLGKSEPVILDYLAKYYAPEETGRRKNLNTNNIEWYVLSLD